MAWKRWQDWLTLVCGLAIIASPFVFSQTDSSQALWSSVVLGGLILLAGLWALISEAPSASEYLVALFGTVLFLAPWLFNYSDITNVAWSAWVIGAATFLSGASVAVSATPTRGHVAHHA